MTRKLLIALAGTLAATSVAYAADDYPRLATYDIGGPHDYYTADHVKKLSKVDVSVVSIFPGWGVSQNSVDPNTGLPTIKNDSGWVRDPQRFPVRLIVQGTPPPGTVRFGSQVNVVVYTGSNPVVNALGAVWIRLISILTYAS